MSLFGDRKKAVLLLKNGELFNGWSFGSEGETTGEVVFNTAMTGYQEILTDPSYNGQIVTMTYSEIGNYGVNSDDVESERIHSAGFVVREYSKSYSNFRAEGSLHDYLKQNGIVGIEGVDTRKLTRILRTFGAMNGIISTVDFDKQSLTAKLDRVPDMTGLDLVPNVTIDKPVKWGVHHPDGWNVIVLHAGIKTNILRLLNARGCNLTLMPAKTPVDVILAEKPDGIFVSNGPGDPAAVLYMIKTLRELNGKVPVFGICLGHQILGLALGAKAYKLKFGHRGANQPIMNTVTGKVEIASHNHGFAISADHFPEDVQITHWNLNDHTVAGLRHKTHPSFSVQYHPEASPGPHDSLYLFDQFISEMRAWKG